MNYPKHYAIKFVTDRWNLEPYSLFYDIPPPDRRHGNVEFYLKLRAENIKLVEKRNLPLWRKLDSTFNINSKQTIRKQIDDEITRIKLGQHLMDTDKMVKEFLDRNYLTGEFIIPVVQSKANDSLYVWRMWRNLSEEEYKSVGDATFADFIINLRDQTIEIFERDN